MADIVPFVGIEHSFRSSEFKNSHRFVRSPRAFLSLFLSLSLSHSSCVEAQVHSRTIYDWQLEKNLEISLYINVKRARTPVCTIALRKVHRFFASGRSWNNEKRSRR